MTIANRFFQSFVSTVISFHRGSSGIFSRIFYGQLARRLGELPIHLVVFVLHREITLPEKRYHLSCPPTDVGPLPSIILLACARLVNVFKFKIARRSALHCPHALGSGQFQSSTLVDSTPSADAVNADEFPAGARVIAGKLLAFVEA